MTLLLFSTLLTLRSWLGYKYSSFMLRMKYYTDFEEMRSSTAPFALIPLEQKQFEIINRISCFRNLCLCMVLSNV